MPLQNVYTGVIITYTVYANNNKITANGKLALGLNKPECQFNATTIIKVTPWYVYIVFPRYIALVGVKHPQGLS